MTRSRKQRQTGRWAARHNRDRFVRQARSGGWRARAVFKLEEIDRKYQLIKPGATVVDLGAAPGSWSQYAAARIYGGGGRDDGDGGRDNGDGDGDGGRIIAVDLRDMPAIDGVDFIRGDFTDAAVAAQVDAALQRPAALVLSDLSPDLSGIRSADQARAEALQSAVLAFCARALRPGGGLLTKVFAGEAAPAVRARLDACFDTVRALKPAASRAQSREVYLLARGFAGDAETGHGDGGESGGHGDHGKSDGETNRGDAPARPGMIYTRRPSRAESPNRRATEPPIPRFLESPNR
ncbi:MAG: RlmE family RNA methyltransferase [Gammaproteobacteria bacterium]|nr:RlmE family RNA methyltransferase [Gammaproteobacteria bacterium]